MADGFECCGYNLHGMEMTKRKMKGGGGKNKRRFSDEQIQSLEVMFESETKLDPKKKLQVARELGLHPRQIAIWFQNKRARWKSKHIEKEYNVLMANYNNLAAEFDTLRKEKQSLVIQLQKLKSEMTMGRINSDGKENRSRIQETATAGNSSDGDGECEVKQIPRECLEGMFSDDDSSCIKAEFLAQLNNKENSDELLSSMDHSSFEWRSASLDHSDDLIMNQPTDDDQCYQWWDFWS